ncbi:hypothetical protein [Epilithonimonas arachidiradicis]|uniref:Lipoprotein n=1 Tax=Epilithonimonas arachidiradicis TaxID=1617282 RepID=A0A420D8M8_9FLAO|nr:hypothetical protein [Epilithonimonas arachidiradicis]RKE87180.1 hypothetical protein BXY58_2056 [Epilithonimonas arachidiradicis]GGG58925.1 hypothetical protein GCM10007332_20740 [Epilithonimonas arachidiradicis]
MKSLILISTIGLLLACNENKTSHNDRTQSISADTTGMMQTAPSNSNPQSDSVSSATRDAAGSGATSTTPTQDSTRQR